ncbi:MAG: glycosyltransferase family 4 protein [Methylacidiphilales bacterium]|nr:glycosyltransferase family 4 protein [Candidatus Methylacidiphilales bacterium]
MAKKVLQIDFSGPWDRGGCLSHITRAWARNARNYEHYFASWAGANYRGTMDGRPHYGFYENARANRIYNKILHLNKCCFFTLTPIIEELKPDILHFHNRHDLVDQVVGGLSYRPKVVCIYHQCYNKLFIPASSDLLIGVGKFVVAWIDRKANPDQPLAVLHNPFRKVEILLRKERSRPLFLNYANDRKATRNLFVAVEMLRAEGFDFELRAVGHVFPDLPVPKGVTVAKFLPQPEFLEVAAQASAYVCATYATPFSVAVLEAMARKTPVICPWDIGALDLLPPDCVISYESHSAVAMADAMRLFLKMPEQERNALAERALEAAETVYDEARLTQRLERLYDTLFADKK